MIEPEVLVKGNFSEYEISINELDTDQSNRKTDPELEEELSIAWQKRLDIAHEKGQGLYDGVSYRLEEFSVEESSLHLVVSTIRFSVRSTLKKNPRLEELGEKFYSHGLSVGGFVETSDGKYVFARKSSRSASSVKDDVIGGVVEEIEPMSGVGLFNMNRAELMEEINVSDGEIKTMKLLGLLRSYTTDILLVTHVLLGVTSTQLRALFEERADKELDDIHLVEKEDLEDFLNELGGYKPRMLDLLK